MRVMMRVVSSQKYSQQTRHYAQGFTHNVSGEPSTTLYGEEALGLKANAIYSRLDIYEATEL